MPEEAPKPVPVPKQSLPALAVSQWLPTWDLSSFDAEEYRRRPPPHFFMFTMPAHQLRNLADIYRRSTKEKPNRALDLAIQRRHDEERSEIIGSYVRYGYPYSEQSKNRRQDAEWHPDLVNPGWLPTAIVVNILKADTERNENKVFEDDLVTVAPVKDGLTSIQVPAASAAHGWRPKQVAPIEVIDGQHRLWAFDHVKEGTDKFQVPVIAFENLDLSWQAYIFWTINIRPKRIPASLAFDLYPLLRSESWMEKPGELEVYRQARAQEIVQVLWSATESPWYHRINMLGEAGQSEKLVNQAAWIRALTDTFLASPQSRRKVGGLYTSRKVGQHGVPWTRAQEAGFIVYLGRQLHDAIRLNQDDWARDLRDQRSLKAGEPDEAFYSRGSLLTNAAGIGGWLWAINDSLVVMANQLKLAAWLVPQAEEVAVQAGVGPIEAVVAEAEKAPFHAFVKAWSKHAATFDWRSATADARAEAKREKQAIRGSAGIRVVRDWLLETIEESSKGDTQSTELKLMFEKLRAPPEE